MCPTIIIIQVNSFALILEVHGALNSLILCLCVVYIVHPINSGHAALIKSATFIFIAFRVSAFYSLFTEHLHRRNQVDSFAVPWNEHNPNVSRGIPVELSCTSKTFPQHILYAMPSIWLSENVCIMRVHRIVHVHSLILGKWQRGQEQICICCWMRVINGKKHIQRVYSIRWIWGNVSRSLLLVSAATVKLNW